MRAAVVKVPREPLTIEERDNPTAGPGEVVVRVRACGVCHTDLYTIDGQIPIARYPVVPGHEVAGTIEALGPGVTHLSVGDRVGVPFLYSSCERCDLCVRGYETFCSRRVTTGIDHDGGFQELMLARADFVVPLPASLSDVDAAPLMCAGVTMFNALHTAGYQPGHKVAIIGLGGTGHVGALLARAMGARLAIVSSSDAKRDEATRLGAELFVAAGREDPVAALRGWSGGADIVISTAPSNDAANRVFPGLAPGGTMVLISPSGQIELSPRDVLMGRRVVGLLTGGRAIATATLQFAASNGVRAQVDPIKLDGLEGALQRMRGVAGFRRAVLVFD